MLFGNVMANNPSRFVNEIKGACIEFEQESSPFTSFGSSAYESGNFGRSSSSFAGFQDTYKKSYDTLHKKPSSSNPWGTAQKKTQSSSFSVGERVRHKVFGVGTIMRTTPMGNDTMLEISFATVGTKKIMANFAKIEKE